jgi:hypothetical protein
MHTFRPIELISIIVGKAEHFCCGQPLMSQKELVFSEGDYRRDSRKGPAERSLARVRNGKKG